MKLIVASILFLAGLEAVLSTAVKASIVYDLDRGVEIRCIDGDPLFIMVFRGVGLLHGNNGTMDAAYPMPKTNSLIAKGNCFGNPISAQSVEQMRQSVYQYCVAARNPYCRY
ncbi:hypothetical protein [Synechococcus elongatus]|uniref:Uncharacterized protein n=2 Tax=Synechococcus elongatus TaxID=32046 RepID=A0AAQ3MCZ1_SYNEL|nr:hypothetical protein [Synechococcus elongatus]QFZ93158.1 hypothetical protein EKO22_13325 [Synechococcus elongatus PCC 11802]